MTSAHERFPTYVEDQREFFDQLISEDWETYSNPEWDARRQFELRQLFKRVSARRVIDVGCGVGYHDLVMAERHGVDEVLGIDYSARSVEVAERAYPHPNVRRAVADIFALPPGEFDLAVSFQVIEHLTEPGRFLEACRRQVAAAGHVAVVTPNRVRLNNRVLRLRRRPHQLADPQHFQEFTSEQLGELGTQSGLRPVDSFGYGLSLIVPKLGREAVPRRPSLSLGRLMPALADVICVIFEVERQ